MTINKVKNKDELIISLSGRLNTSTAPMLEEELKQNLSGIILLVFDLKDLEYVSSAGLRVFLVAQKTMNKQGKMVVRNVNSEIGSVFEMTGFADIITIE